ncbi:DUF2628 domain-containing protein, partial [Salmonella enterica subsp. enterica serovar Virchow]|nr:DUF2628 domain-containing protein [Salmonella enterica subsp. enterica serovar Virchow]
LWLAAVVTVAVLVAINVVIASGHVAPIFSWLSLLVSLFVGLEGPAMRIAALRRSGYEDTVALTAETLDDAELRYLDWLDSDRGTAPSVQAAPVTASHAGRPALGLLGYPGRS